MKLSQTAQFKRDIKRQLKKGKDGDKITALLTMLLAGQSLPAHYKDHPLRGTWKGRRDCHVEPDWILIYKISPDKIRLERTGSHSDLF